MNILDRRFKYTPSTSTSIVRTWRRFGYVPTTEQERAARQKRAVALASNVTPIRKAKP